MASIHVTAHAIERYRERVANVPEAQARAMLASNAVRTAIAFVCEYVRLGTGQRIVIENGCIVTVLPAGHKHKSRRRREFDE